MTILISCYIQSILLNMFLSIRMIDSKFYILSATHTPSGKNDTIFKRMEAFLHLILLDNVINFAKLWHYFHWNFAFDRAVVRRWAVDISYIKFWCFENSNFYFSMFFENIYILKYSERGSVYQVLTYLKSKEEESLLLLLNAYYR